MEPEQLSLPFQTVSRGVVADSDTGDEASRAWRSVGEPAYESRLILADRGAGSCGGEGQVAILETEP
jgi:hypothetical protein